MNLLFRRLFKDIAIYGIGDLLLKATAFITMPIYTRIFTPEDYGVWSFVATVVGLLSGILILGGDSAYARFFFEAKTLRERQLVTSTWLGFLALWSGGVILLCLPFTEIFSQWSFGTHQYSTLLILALLAAPISLINTMCGQVLRNQSRYSTEVVRKTSLRECPAVNMPADKIQENLRILVENPALRKELGEAGRKYVEKYHSLEAMGKILDKVYRKIWLGESSDFGR